MSFHVFVATADYFQPKFSTSVNSLSPLFLFIFLRLVMNAMNVVLQFCQLHFSFIYILFYAYSVHFVCCFGESISVNLSVGQYGMIKLTPQIGQSVVSVFSYHIFLSFYFCLNTAPKLPLNAASTDPLSTEFCI